MKFCVSSSYNVKILLSASFRCFYASSWVLRANNIKLPIQRKHNRWKIQQVEANKLAFWKRGRVEFRTTNWDKFNQLPDRDWNPEHAHTKLAPQPIHHGIKFNIRHGRPYFSSLICRRFLLHTETRSEERARQKNNRGECKKQQKFRKLQTLLF